MADANQDNAETPSSQTSPPSSTSILDAADTFARRHIGPDEAEISSMLATLGFSSLEQLSDAAIPEAIRAKTPLALSGLPGGNQPLGEFELVERLRELASSNRVQRSFIGMGYSDVIVPPVVQRNILENPGWYTQYTPYQAEISQGRLEALLIFQTMVADLTGLPLANASLLDEGTAAAEAMGMCNAVVRGKRAAFFVSEDCHPQTIGVVRTRGEALGLSIQVGNADEVDFASADLCGILLQYPTTDGRVQNPRALIGKAHEADTLVVMAADLMALLLLTPPGEFGADIAIGSTQRFGVPLGFGGPHAAYLSTLQAHARRIPGRLVGVSLDAHGNPAYRLAIQTREQHIRRDKATSNICTAQVLLAIMAAMYAVYHGPDGLRRIARRIHAHAAALALGLRKQGHEISDETFFDAFRVTPKGSTSDQIIEAANERGINLRRYDGEHAGSVGIALDETVSREDLRELLAIFGGSDPPSAATIDALCDEADTSYPEGLARTSEYLEHEAFHLHHSESEMLRFMRRLESRDLSLTTSMIPLGSCTMKLNATSEMMPVSWPEFARIHPYAPKEQTRGYAQLFSQLETWLGEITGLPAVSLQPNAGSQGEFAGLLAIRRFHRAQDGDERDVCLIPISAHGTNAASAVIAGFRCVAVACDAAGNVLVADLAEKAAQHADKLGALMITYPSTHGVFEESIRDICRIMHEHGGQVYMDGANLNAQVGLTSPARLGADVCHMNLHKTFCIPHGGGGPGMGPIAAAEHLRPYLPGDPISGESAVSAAPYGSPSILPISWTYIALMGAAELTRATQVAILNANYMAKRLSNDYSVLYTGPGGLVAHEFIIDCRGFERSAGVAVEDIAKRLMDYGFHAPTMSFPVPGTLMIEPTESETRAELDRLCDALRMIRDEIRSIESGEADRDDNPLKHAPRTAAVVSADEWPHAYSRAQAAYPAAWVREHKYWPPVGRIDNAYGDRNLVCTCPPLENLVE